MTDPLATLRARCVEGYAPDSVHTLALLDALDATNADLAAAKERIRVLEAIVE